MAWLFPVQHDGIQPLFLFLVGWFLDGSGNSAGLIGLGGTIAGHAIRQSHGAPTGCRGEIIHAVLLVLPYGCLARSSHATKIPALRLKTRKTLAAPPSRGCSIIFRRREALKKPDSPGDRLSCTEAPALKNSRSCPSMRAMNTPTIKLEPDWLEILQPAFEHPSMKTLKTFLQYQKDAGKIIYPKGADIFNALNTTRLKDVRVVILGQDPYHGPGQAHGLCFSVPDGVPLPPSLRNIYKEIEAEYGGPMPLTGNLSAWAEQGVLLLNATLTVEAGLAGSHQKKGWEEFTDAIIRAVNSRCEHVVFLLWGSYAQKKGSFIDRNKHLVLQSPHPSPLSAHRGFLGNGHFRKANEYLERHGQTPVNWHRL
jgi:uracil-DNA glycosylase